MILKDFIKPCPFCGGEGKLYGHDEGSGFGGVYHIELVACSNCGATSSPIGNDKTSDTREQAILAVLAWNRRAEDG